MADQRDATTWVAVELSRAGEALASEGGLERILRRDLNLSPEHGVFIPVAVFQRAGSPVALHLLEGYAFVESGLDETRYFDLERMPYVAQIMSFLSGPHRLRTLSVVPNSKIEEMRLHLRRRVSSSILEGATVEVVEGQYKGLEGRVVGSEGDMAFVRVTMRSIDFVVTVPRIFLEAVL